MACGAGLLTARGSAAGALLEGVEACPGTGLETAGDGVGVARAGAGAGAGVSAAAATGWVVAGGVWTLLSAATGRGRGATGAPIDGVSWRWTVGAGIGSSERLGPAGCGAALSGRGPGLASRGEVAAAGWSLAGPSGLKPSGLLPLWAGAAGAGAAGGALTPAPSERALEAGVAAEALS